MRLASISEDTDSPPDPLMETAPASTSEDEGANLRATAEEEESPADDKRSG